MRVWEGHLQWGSDGGWFQVPQHRAPTCSLLAM